MINIKDYIKLNNYQVKNGTIILPDKDLEKSAKEVTDANTITVASTEQDKEKKNTAKGVQFIKQPEYIKDKVRVN